jgi:hypothetical protein
MQSGPSNIFQRVNKLKVIEIMRTKAHDFSHRWRADNEFLFFGPVASIEYPVAFALEVEVSM